MDRGRELEASEKDEKRSDGIVAASIRNNPDGEKIENTPVLLDEKTISSVKAICEQLRAYSLAEKVRCGVRDVCDRNLELLKQLSLESLKYKSDNLDGANPPPLVKNDISMARPRDAFERMDSLQHVPLKDLLHYFRCDHVHPTEYVEDLYNAFYSEFKYHADRRRIDPSYGPRIDAVTRVKEWCYTIHSKLQWISYVKSPLNAMMFFESYCDFITKSCRVHGLGHEPTIEQLKLSLTANKDTINKCAYLTPINDSTFRKQSLIEFYDRLMVAIEECRLEFNARRKKYLRDENRQLEPTLPILENKLLLAIREHDCQRLEEELVATHDSKVLDEMRKKAELLKEASELREFIKKKEESVQIDVEKRVKEAEAKESSQNSSVSERLQQMRGLKGKLSSDLELINSARMISNNLESRSCTSSGSKDAPFSPGGRTLPVSRIKSKKPVESTTRCLRSSRSSGQTPPSSSQPSTSQPSASKTTRSSSGKAKKATRSRFLISDPDLKHPQTTFDYMLAVEECKKESKRIRKEIKAKDEEKMKLEEEIEKSKRLELEKSKKPGKQSSGVKKEKNEAINLCAEEMSLQKAIDESLRVSRRGSSRPPSRQSSNSADSEFFITID